jgi:O-antigen/teichoic acid export membrane protein
VNLAIQTGRLNFKIYQKVLANLAGFIAGSALPILMSPIVLRIVGPSEFGLIGVFNALMAVTVIFDYGVALVLNREIARHLDSNPENRLVLKTVQGSLELLLLVIAAVMTMFAFGASGWLVSHWLQVPAAQSTEARYCIMLGAAALFLPRVKAFSIAVLNAKGRQVEHNLISFGANLLRYVAGISVLLLFSKSALGYLIAQFLVSITEAILFHIRAWKGIPRAANSPFWSGRYVGSVMPSLLANWGANLGATVIITADKILVSGAVPIAEYGRYVFIATIATTIGGLVSMSQEVYLSLMVRLFTANDQENLARTYRAFSTISAALVISGSVGAIVFGDHLLLLLMGKNAEPILYFWKIFALLAAGGLLSALTRVAHAIQITKGRPDVALHFNMVGAVVYPLTLWIAVGRWGLIGAASTWFAFNLLYFVPFLAVTSRIYRPVPTWLWIGRHLVAPLVISAIVLIAARQLGSFGIWGVWIGFVLGGGTACGLCLLLDPSVRSDIIEGLGKFRSFQNVAPPDPRVPGSSR